MIKEYESGQSQPSNFTAATPVAYGFRSKGPANGAANNLPNWEPTSNMLFLQFRQGDRSTREMKEGRCSLDQGSTSFEPTKSKSSEFGNETSVRFNKGELQLKPAIDKDYHRSLCEGSLK